ncbi:MAG TPA: oxygenase MpaB family protein [Pseudomonadales bacterium]|nr:oxygenase MpaB family protein [Pseudomonadales bacterium]
MENTDRKVDLAPEPVALGPDSMVWKHGGDNLQLLMAGTTIGLQVAHPVVGAGVGDHSVFKKDPWGRLKRTTEWGVRLLYGGPQKALQAGKELRDLHRDIKGTDGNGRKYFALDPEAYAWVHMTTYYTLVMTQKLFCERPFTAQEEAQLYREWLQQGRVMGIRAEDMPPDVPAFWQYFEAMIANRLEDTEMVRYILDVSFSKVKKPPQLKFIPDVVWERFYGGVGQWFRMTAIATMPQSMRDKLNLPWTAKDQKRFERFRRFVRTSAPLLPLKARYLPPAYEMLKQRLSKKS